jgi:epsilon-lactone hydrolase
MDLPVFQTMGEILEYCWARRRYALTYAAIPIGLIVIAKLTAWQMGLDVTDFQSPAFVILNLISAIIFLPFTVTWYRMIILGEADLATRGLFSFTRLEGRLIGWQLIIGLIVLAAGGAGILLIGGITSMLGAANEAAGQVLMPALLGIWAVIITALACRLSLVLAMAATDRPVILSEAWARTEGLGVRMAAIFILCVLCVFLLLVPLQLIVVVITAIVGLLSDGLAESAGIVFGTIAVALGSLMILVFPTTLFAFVYNRISKTMAAPEIGATDQSGHEGDRPSNPDLPPPTPEVSPADEVSHTLAQLTAYIGDQPKETAEDLRILVDGFFSRLPMPEDVTLEDVDAGGVPARWVTADVADPDRVVLLLHGGGFSAGSITSHQHLAADLSMACSARVLLIEYRLAPEHPYPAGLEDCVTAYRWLLKEGFKPGHLAIAGNSAGGGLSVSTALHLKERSIDQPAALVVMSPWVNLACDGETIESKAKNDPITTEKGLRRAAEDYLAGHDPKDPMVSPVFGDLRGLPPLLIQVGSREILLDDSRKLAARAKADDLVVRLEEWPGMFHNWHMMADSLTDGKRALGGIGAFVRRNMG